MINSRYMAVRRLRRTGRNVDLEPSCERVTYTRRHYSESPEARPEVLPRTRVTTRRDPRDCTQLVRAAAGSTAGEEKTSWPRSRGQRPRLRDQPPPQTPSPRPSTILPPSKTTP